MGVLPTGTVTLLFSDIEGSTVLLSRLGSAYAEALDGQRRVLRKAWAEQGGTELGTEGDSFFVAFPTAERAVAAAVQAQRELVAFAWPAGESVRVRMGIHTGTPQLHDGGYVGMDVHRAARIASAAHGGQVVVSSATAELVAGCLPDRVALRDLGSHQLKDIAQVEHLFQLAIEGLPQDFPALRTLGAVSRLPRPATPLVGRDGELADLTAALSSPDVRLATLTGPGGSGKTRLAIAVAHRLVPTLPDGVFFVSLAPVTTSQVMWITIAEALDLPPEGRTPSAVTGHLAHRHALVVLDNLEQAPTADEVVAALLDAAPRLVLVATSRRPLHVAGEHEHPVPPLQLPSGDDLSDLDGLSGWGAVGMFVQYAKMVRPGFELTASNATDVVQVCRRLDGLPLAIELAAARTKLLSPAALVTRLDSALDLAAAGKHVPDRQKTLRDTIAWSYRQLTPEQQAFFRCLGVFPGGGSLDAITAVTADTVDADPFDLVADLADASLVTITDDENGEPRVGMLETIRAYALDQLSVAAELDRARERHALYYLSRATWLRAQIDGGSSHGGGSDRILEARRQFEAETDNYRAALGWTLPPHAHDPRSSRQKQLGLQLCAELSWPWVVWDHLSEGLQWLTRAAELAPDEDSGALGRCLSSLAFFLSATGREQAALPFASRSVEICRRLDDKRALAEALMWQGQPERRLGNIKAARHHLEEALALANETNDEAMYAFVLAELAHVEYQAGHPERRVELERAALRIFEGLGHDYWTVNTRQNLACSLRLLGRLQEADQYMREAIPRLLQMGRAGPWLAEDYAALLADLDSPEAAARLIGAAEAFREQRGVPRDGELEADYRDAFTRARKALSAQTWNREYQKGHAMTLEDALTEAYEAALSSQHQA